MYHFFVKPEQIGEQEIFIEGPDVKHIRNVLRMRPGEQVRLCTGLDNQEYRCEIVALEADTVRTKILWKEESGAELPSKIYLFQGLPKSDKLELIIQKAVELGVYEIIPVAVKRTVVKLDQKKEAAKQKRWAAISESAAKQSKRLLIPKIAPVMSFSQALEYAKELDVKLIPYERAEDMDRTREIFRGIEPGQSVGIFIGPEGGFEPEEIDQALEQGAFAITLGRRILRTETAGMSVLSVLMFQLEDR